MPNFPKNEHFQSPDIHAYVCISGGRKYLFFGKFGVLCFLETPILRFALLSYYQQNRSLNCEPCNSKMNSKQFIQFHSFYLVNLKPRQKYTKLSYWLSFIKTNKYFQEDDPTCKSFFTTWHIAKFHREDNWHKNRLYSRCK